MVLPAMTDSSGQTRYLAIGAGKDGNIYLVDRTTWVSSIRRTIAPFIRSWTAPCLAVFGPCRPITGAGLLRRGGRPHTGVPVHQGAPSSTPASLTATQFPYPGATPSISANGAANGILWALENNSLAVLHAYSADNLAQELYNTNQASNGRDHFGAGNKFMVPTIANGKVYVGTPKGVAAFGLLSPQSHERGLEGRRNNR